MLFTNINILNENFELIKDQYVGVQGAFITYIGNDDPRKLSDINSVSTDFGEIYDGKNKLLIPGLFNLHAHSTMTLLRGYAENLPLQRWLNEMVFPFEAKITPEAALPATRLAIAEMLRYGIVSFSDMYFFDDARAQAIEESGIKCNISTSISCFDPDAHYKNLPLYAANEHLFHDLNGAFDGRLLMDMCLHSEYTTTPNIVREVAEKTLEYGVGMHVHVSETKSEVEECKERHGGLTPPAYLAKLGVFDSRTTAAHCVWLEDEDIEILNDKDVTIATNPASNLKLGSGFLPLKKICDKGVRLAIGTDGVASNNAHNLFRDMYLLATIHRGAELNPVGLSPADILHIATEAGAYAQGRNDCGKLATGYRADLVVLDIDKPWMQPITDMATNLIYSESGEDVVLTMVDGKITYKDGQWASIDVEKAIAETTKYKDEIVSDLASSL